MKMIKVAVPQVGDREIAAVADVLRSGLYVSGERVREFERAFAAYVGTPHAVAVNSGTAALHIAMQAMGIGPGDEVIVPPLTFFATVSSVIEAGARPVFADIEPDTLCLSPEDCARRITPRTKALLPVHIFGAPARMGALRELAEAHGLALLEDCAQAHGTMHAGRKAGSLGTAGCFSFFATKQMTTGEGGLISTHDKELADKARMIRSHGMTDRDTHAVFGLNNRMTEMAAAMGLVQLERLDRLNARRIENSQSIIAALRSLDWAHVPQQKDLGSGNVHTYFWCPVMVDAARCGKDINDLKAHLKANGIGFRQRYTEPLYRQPVLAGLGLDYGDVRLPVIEKVAGNVIGLPNHPGLAPEELQRVQDVLAAF